MNDPGVILLDEPSGGLDLGGREQLVAALADLAADPTSPPYVMVTHHVDEIPPGTTHVMLLRHGRAIAQGEIADTLTAQALSECFDVQLELHRRPDARYSHPRRRLLRAEHAGQTVTLAGWVARRRDHGGVTFIDLREASGVVQVVIRDEAVAHQLRSEYCVQVDR